MGLATGVLTGHPHSPDVQITRNLDPQSHVLVSTLYI